MTRRKCKMKDTGLCARGCVYTVTEHGEGRCQLGKQTESSGRAVAMWMPPQSPCLTKLETRQAYIRLYYPTPGLTVSRLHSIKQPLALTALRGKGLIELVHKCNLAWRDRAVEETLFFVKRYKGLFRKTFGGGLFVRGVDLSSIGQIWGRERGTHTPSSPLSMVP